MGGLIRLNAFAAVLMLPMLVASQDLRMLPKWKKDDQRTLYVTQTLTVPGAGEEGEEGDEVIKSQLTGRVKVYEVTSELMRISIDHENVVLPELRPFFEKELPAELSPYKRMTVRYEIDRNTGVSRLLNVEDVRLVARRSMEISARVLRRTDAAAATTMEEQLAPLVQQFNDSLLVEQYFDDRFGSLTRAFGKPLQEGTPLKVEEVRADRLGVAGDSLHISTATVLQSQSAEQVVLNVTQVTDVRPRAPLKKNTPPQKTAPAKETSAVETIRIMQKELEETIMLDPRTTWPQRMTRTTTMRMSDGSTRSEEISIEVR